MFDKLASNELDDDPMIAQLLSIPHSLCLNKVQCFRRQKNNSYIVTVIATTNLLEYIYQELFNGNKKNLHELMLPQWQQNGNVKIIKGERELTLINLHCLKVNELCQSKLKLTYEIKKLLFSHEQSSKKKKKSFNLSVF